jgi:hypothetical protein
MQLFRLNKSKFSNYCIEGGNGREEGIGGKRDWEGGR